MFKQALQVILMYARVREPLPQSSLLTGSEVNPLPQGAGHFPTSGLWWSLTPCLESLREETLSYLLKFFSLLTDSLQPYLFRKLFVNSSGQNITLLQILKVFGYGTHLITARVFLLCLILNIHVYASFFSTRMLVCQRQELCLIDPFFVIGLTLGFACIVAAQ